MKTLLLLLLSCYLILVTCPSLNAQWVTIPDSNFVNWLNANIPQCMNGNQMDTTCAGVVNATDVNCSNAGIADLTGIRYFDNLTNLICKENSLITLPVLPKNLYSLDCSENQLAGFWLFSVLPYPSLRYLNCSRNFITDLTIVGSSLWTLDCSFNYLTFIYIPAVSSLNCSYNAIDTIYYDIPWYMQSLDISYNQLTSLPALPSGLKYLYCQGNGLSSLPTLPQNLEILTCGDLLTSLPPLPPSLKRLDCFYNQLTVLPPLPQNLNYLRCSYNQLTSLPELPDSLSDLFCDNNPLTCMPKLKKIGRLVFVSTGITCLPNYGNVTTSNPPINSLPICDSASGCNVFVWNISGTVTTETGSPIPGVTVTLSGNRSEITTTLTDGSFSFLVDRDGDYTVTPSKNNDVNTNNGITTIDLLQMRAHILGMLPLPSPYKIIAADVDGSSTVTTLDILHTRQMILQMTTTFPNGRLWSFVPSDYVFTDMQNPFPFPTTRTYTNLQQSVTGQDFIGIKLGDVNDSWDATIP